MRVELYKDLGGWILSWGDLSAAIEQRLNGETVTAIRCKNYGSSLPQFGSASCSVHVVPADLTPAQWRKAKDDPRYARKLVRETYGK